MRRYNIVLIVALAICLAPLYVIASPFDNPPEDNWDEWKTSYPYQRNIYVDFTTNPSGGPYSTGIPGADYEGWADPDIWESDFVSYTGDVIYDGTGERMGAEAIGGDAIGSGIIHIDNLDRPYAYKNFWIELHLDVSNPLEVENWINYNFAFDEFDEYTLDWEPDYMWLYETDPNYGYGIYTWGTIYPNPVWEEIQFTFTIPEDEWAWIYDVHVATECVPIPAAVWLLGTGLIGIVGMRRKLQK
jgi:hypothetical protein